MKRVAFFTCAAAFILTIVLPMSAHSDTFVEEWGFIGNRTGGWAIGVGDSGNVSISGGEIQDNWAAIHGGFETISLQAYSENALVITGTMEFIGAGFESWSGLRYGVFYSDSAGAVEYADTDSAHWSGTENHHSGYLFIPKSGTNDPAIWLYTGPGTHGAVVDWRWLSTYGANSYTLGEFNQSPPRAVATEGIYDFAISIQLITPETIEIRFYLRKKDDSYFFGGISTDTHSPLVTTKFNCVCFAVSNLENDNPNLNAFHLRDVNVGLGEPLSDGHRPVPHYISDWGIIGNRFGGWTFTSGELIGNVNISGDSPNHSWTTLRGGFDLIQPTLSDGLIVTGKVEFVGGGFEANNSFRFGLFHSDSAGVLITTPQDSTHWSGTDGHHSGYLFIPPSGHNTGVRWAGNQQNGAWGVVVDDVLFSPEGANSMSLGYGIHEPEGAIASEGSYDFAMAIKPLEDGSNKILCYLVKEDESYSFRLIGYDTHIPQQTTAFNCVAFALDSGNTTTAVQIEDVLVEIGTVPNPVSVKSDIQAPVKSRLQPNFPNPFNPITQISYSISTPGHVLLQIYNIYGQQVAILFDGEQAAGRYTVPFNGDALPSGVYIYRLIAPDVNETRKLTLLK